MKLLCRSLIVAALAALLPSAAHAQWGFFGGGPSWGSYSPYQFYGGPYFGGSPYGGYGYPGWGGGYGYYSTTYITPVISVASTATAAPLIRSAVYPATPWRESAVMTAGAHVDVRVPAADAQVWIDGVRMKQTGLERRFVTPALDAGSVYDLEVRASWCDPAGVPYTQTRRLNVRAGNHQTVDFTVKR